MAEQDDIHYDVGLDVTEPLRALEQLANRLNNFDDKLIHSVGVVQNQMRKAAKEYVGYIRNMENQLKELQAQGADTSKQQAFLANARARQTSAGETARRDYASGTSEQRSRQAAVNREIAEIRASQEALMNRISKEILNTTLDSIRTTRAQVEARIKEEQFSARRLASRTTDPMLRAREADASFRDNEFLKNVGQQAVTGRRADTRRAIEQIEDRFGVYQANIAEATFRSTQRILNASENEFRNRGERAELRRYRNRLFNPRDEQVLADRAAEERSYRARNGDAAAGLRKTRERMDLNGGADFMAMQAGLLNNYMLIGGAYGAGAFLGNFVVQLDKEFKQFQAITDTTNAAMETMEQRLISVSEKTKFTALEIAQASTLMGQAGLSANQVADTIEPISLLATAAGTDLKDAVDIVTSTLNVFNLQTSEAGHIADVYTAALNRSKLTLDQLTVSLQYAGNTAATAGVGYNELTASIGALANAGIRSGSTMGTGIRQLLVDLMNPSQNLIGELEKVGLTLADVNVEANGLTGVITNLQAAGFGTAEAFAGFEVRAAAAFTALASNVDTITTLRQSFLLNTAAAKANETQMEALANTWAKFTSTAGATAYTAFKPTVGLLQEVLDTVADMIGGAREADGVIRFLGTGIASLATAWAVVKIGGIIIGLGRMAAGAQAASTAVGILFGILRLSPIGMSIAVATAATTAFLAWSDSAAAAADALDKIDTRLGTMSGNVSEAQNRIQSINDTIEDLIKKRENLEKVGNESLRATRALEIVSTFSELADTIDVSTASVGDLIEALRGLKGELASDLPAQFENIIANLNLKIGELQRTIAEYRSLEGNQDLGSFVSTYLPEAQQNTGLASVMSGETDFASMQDEVAKLFGDAAAKVFGAMADGQNLTGSQAIGLRDRLNAQQARNSLDLLTLRASTAPTAEELAEIERLERSAIALEALSKMFEPIAANLINLEATRKDVELNEANLRKATLQATPAYQAIETQAANLSSFTTEGLREISRAMGADGKGLDTQEVADRLKALDDAFNAKLKEIDDAAAALAEEFAAQEGITTERAASIIDTAGYREQISQIQNDLAAENKSSAEQVNKINAFLKKGEKQTIQRQIEAQLQRLSKATTEHEVDVIKAYLTRLQDELSTVNAEIEKLVINKDIADSPSAQKINAAELEEQERLRREEVNERILEQRRKIYAAAREEEENRARTELRTIEDEMRLLLGQMNGNATVEMIAAIKKKMDELASRARILAGQIAAIDVGQDFIPQTGATGFIAENMSGGNAPVSSANSVKAQVWNFFAGKNLQSHQIAGIMGNVQTESGFDPRAIGDGGDAHGLFQWNDRRHKFFDFIGGRQNIGDVQKHLEFAWSELMSTEGEAYRRLLAAKNVREATDAVIHFERPSGYNARNPNPTRAMHYDRRLAGAENAFREFAGNAVPPASEQRATAVTNATNDNLGTVNQTQAEAEKKEAQLARNRVARSATAAGKAIEAEINTLMTQSSKVSSPGALESLLDQVRGKWQDVIANETKAFTAKNEGSENFAEDLDNFRKGLDAKLNQDVVQLLDRYQQVIEQEVPEQLKVARAQLEAAQDPANVGRYTDLDIQRMQTNVALLEREAITTRLNALEQFRALLTQELTEAEARYGATSEQANAIRARQAELERSVGDLRISNTAHTEAASRAEYSLGDAIEAANAAWMQRNGLMDANGKMISGAQQFGEAWGQVLDGLTSGFATLFTNLAEGQMSAGEAFKQFGLTVLQMLTEIIAKSLALQLVQGLTGGAGGGGIASFFGSIFGGGAATGAIIPGVTRAANGEYVTGNAPFRDGELRSVQPGEMILRASAVNAIGRDAMTKMNALGNRSLDGGMPTLDQPKPVIPPATNVWILPPEEQPQMGPSDIVAVITDDMRRRGSTRQLIKAIAGGQM